MGAVLAKSILALHGFLGSESDFDLWRPILEKDGSRIHTFNLWQEIDAFYTTQGVRPVDRRDLDESGFMYIAKKINEVARTVGAEVLLGYSLGARLSLYAFAQDPAKWQEVLLLSCHPGLTNENDRANRWNSDLVWSEKIRLASNWAEFMLEWNSQSVFQTDHERSNLEVTNGPSLQKPSCDREILAKSILTFSLSKQRFWDFHEIPQTNKIKWFTGSDDKKFTDLAKRYIPKENHRILQGGHRLLKKKITTADVL